MVPLIAAAAIKGASDLLGGLFSMKAAAKKREQEALQEGAKNRAEAEGNSAKILGDQTPFQQLMAGYNFLGKRGM